MNINIIEAIQTYRTCPVCNGKTDVIATINEKGRCDYTLINNTPPFLFARKSGLGSYPHSFILNTESYHPPFPDINISCPQHYYCDIEKYLGYQSVIINEKIIFGGYIIVNDRRLNSTRVWNKKEWNQKMILSLPYIISTQKLNFNNENEFKNKLESLMVLV